MTTHALLLWLHLLSAAWWVGGMAVILLALRPALAGALAAPRDRLGVMAAVLARFLRGVDAAVALLFATGGVIMARAGGDATWPGSIHAMAGLAVVMALLYAVIRARLFPALRAALASGDAPAGAKALEGIRRIVTVNLALGVLVFACGVAAR